VVVSVPLVGWVLSSFVLHGAGLALPNGLQGEYALAPYHPGTARLEEADLLPPSRIPDEVERAGLTRIYWLRLETLVGVPAYIVKPGPFELEWVLDARTGARLDPLADARLLSIADEELTGTRAVAIGDGDEFNRYYALDRVPAVTVEMEGDQPSQLVLSRASGRVSRRSAFASPTPTARISTYRRRRAR